MIPFDIFLAVVSSFASSIATIFKSEAVKELGPFAILSFGSLLGAVILLGVSFIYKSRLSLKILRENLKDFLILVITRGILGDLLLVVGLSLTTGIKAIFFTKAEPYFILLLFWMLKKEPIKQRHVLLLFFHILGAIGLSTGFQLNTLSTPQLGDLCIIAAMGCYAYSYFSATRLSQEMGAIPTNMYMLFLSGVVFLPFALLLSPPAMWYSTSGWTNLALSTVLFTVFGLTLWFTVLKTMKGWIVSALRSTGPLLGAPFAYFFFGQQLTFLQGVAGIVVLATSFLIAREHISRK